MIHDYVKTKGKPIDKEDNEEKEQDSSIDEPFNESELENVVNFVKDGKEEKVSFINEDHFVDEVYDHY